MQLFFCLVARWADTITTNEKNNAQLLYKKLKSKKVQQEDMSTNE